MATTIVTIAEIVYDVHRFDARRRRSSLETRFEQLITPDGGIGVLAAERRAAREAGRFRALREGLGLSDAPSDMVVAGITASARGGVPSRAVPRCRISQIPMSRRHRRDGGS